MPTNDRIILDELLCRRQMEVDPDAAASSFFEFFTAAEVLKDFDLSYHEIESGLVGDGGDGGVDAIYLLVNGDLVQEDSDYGHLKKDITVELCILQSKMHSGFQETPIERFLTMSNDLFDLSTDVSTLSSIYNEGLIDSIQRFHTLYRELAASLPALKVTFVYASKGAEPNENVRRKVCQLKDAVTSHFSDCSFEFEFLGAPELLVLARRNPEITYGLPLAQSPISSGDQIGFVCLVRLRDFFNFITDDKEALQRQMFESNVRDYQGRSQVNDEIQESLRDVATEDFWWLNNGVSILATQASFGGNTLTIKEPQIVNGLQTSTEVYKFCKESDDTDDERTILVRVMVPTEEASRDRIIKATNRQTSVQVASLRATDKIHRDIEEYLRPRGLFYDRRKNYYKNQGKPRDKIVGIPHLAQAVMAIVLRRPDTARARPSSLLKNDEDYLQVFNPSYPINLYYVCAEAMRRVERHLKSPSLNLASKDRNNLRFYVAMHAVAGVGNRRRSASEIANFELAGLDQTAVEQSLETTQPKFLELGGDDRVSKGPVLLEVLLCGGRSAYDESDGRA